MRNFRTRAVVLLAVAGAAVVIPAAGSASAATPGLKTCQAAVKGTPWVEPGGPLKGTIYVVRVATISCAKAEKLVAGMVGQKVKQIKPGVYVAPTPPRGETCYVTPDTTKRAYIGRCAKASGGPFVFTWEPGNG